MNLKDHFPRASKSFLDANKVIISGMGRELSQPPTKNDVQPIVERKKGKYETNHQRKIPDSEPEHHQTPALDGADAGKTKSMDGAHVRFIGFRVRPLDPDNFAGSCKDLLDGCVHAKLLHGDEWWRITLETRQEKVKSYAEEKTVIEIEL